MDAGKGLAPSSFIQTPNCGSGCARPAEHAHSRLEWWGWSQDGSHRPREIPGEQESSLPAQGTAADKHLPFPP